MTSIFRSSRGEVATELKLVQHVSVQTNQQRILIHLAAMSVRSSRSTKIPALYSAPPKSCRERKKRTHSTPPRGRTSKTLEGKNITHVHLPRRPPDGTINIGRTHAGPRYCEAISSLLKPAARAEVTVSVLPSVPCRGVTLHYIQARQANIPQRHRSQSKAQQHAELRVTCV